MINLEYKTLDNLIENELKMQTQRFKQKQQEIINNSLEEKDKEIERLNNINNQQTSDIQVLMYEKENLERLVAKKDNIIDELEKDIDLELYKTRANDEYNNGLFNAFRYVKDTLDKLKELKESK